MEHDSDWLSLKIQNLAELDRVLVLASVCGARSTDSTVTGNAVDELFWQVAIPRPAKIGNAFSSLQRRDLMTSGKSRGQWRVTPKGQARVQELMGKKLDSLALESRWASSSLGHAVHPLVPPTLAPPSLVDSVGRFTAMSPATGNVFGMTRFPSSPDQDVAEDPLHQALAVAESALGGHELKFLLASERAIVDDLWGNVTAHMWASNFGIAFFEDLGGRGLNYNLVIEVGAMLMTGRRCLLLKDASIAAMPTDLVGMIYKPVDLTNPSSVARAVHEWASEDLALGPCTRCAVLQ